MIFRPVVPRTTYRHHVVLEPASDWNEDITASFIRLVKNLDNQTGLPVLTDTAGKAFQITAHHFLLENRQQQQALRALFYYLRGRQRAIWVSSNATDIYPVSDIHGNTFDIEYQQFTKTVFEQNGRRDLRLELNDGRVLYRRIVAATVLDAQRERLSLDGDELNVSLSHLRKLSFLTLSRLESDTIRWQHHTDSDGVATVSVNFRAVRDDLEAI